jgi:hypothetical protein
MTFSAQDLRDLVKKELQERQWNKDSETPRDYSKEYNAPGSKEQDERNKRKRDKRKYDKENGECPSGEELHHTNGIEEDEVECEPVSKNRGRKGEGGRMPKDIKIRITETRIRQIIQEETVEVVNEIFPALAGLAIKGAMGLGKLAVGGAKMAGKGAMGLGKMVASPFIGKSGAAKAAASKVGQMRPKTFSDTGAIINALIQQAADEGGLKGDPEELKQALTAAGGSIDLLKKQAGEQ